MKIQIHPEALKEFEKAILWYKKRSLFAPQRFRNEVQAGYLRVLAAPQTFPVVLPRRRKALLHKFPYSPVFEEKPETINIIAIAHAKRKTAYWRRRQMEL